MMTTKRTAARIEKADRKASHRLNDERDSWPMRLIGSASDIGDQPQMRLLCAAAIALGALRHDGKLAKTGVAMLAAHTLATWAKSGVKAVVDRTRPNREQNGYRFGLGDSEAHSENSFPSGHSAGAVAVARAFVRNYPEYSVAALSVAGAVAAVQIPRGTHFIGDVLAGSLIGLIAEGASHAIGNAAVSAITLQGHAPFSVAQPLTAALRIPPTH